MPIDYSKWDNLDDSDDDESCKPIAAPAKPAPPPKAPAKPAEASGSQWNLNSWHFEETKLDKWGEERLRSLLDKAKHKTLIVHKADLELELELALDIAITKIEGEAWTHIRKGKKATGYNYEMSFGWNGSVSGGTARQDVHGTLEYELTVDDDEPSFVFSCVQDVPFKKEIQSALLGFINQQCQVFVKELSDKGGGGKGWQAAPTESNVQVGQYKKYTDGVDGVAKSAEVAASLGAIGEGKQKKLHTDVKTL